MKHLLKIFSILLVSFKAYAADADPQAFVQRVGDQIVKVLAEKNQSLDARKNEFHSILTADFDIKGIGKFVLSRYWRQATAAQKEEYLKLFEQAIVDNYAAQFDNYNNESLEVVKVKEAEDGGMVVSSHVLRQSGQKPMNVDWKVFPTKNGLKVLDIVVDGVSMSITQRSEYADVINQHNGDMDGLLAFMRTGKLHPENKAS